MFLFFSVVILSINNQAQTVTDIDGNVYNTVTIGDQIWMKENLKVQKYNNGNPISHVIDSAIWVNQFNGAYCYYNNDSITYSDLYGKLYNYYAIEDSRKICPIGWSIPTQTDWETLFTHLGGVAIAGGKMKETGTAHWLSPNTDATNSSGFAGLPGGFRRSTGSFGWVDTTSNWWSSTPVSCYVWMYRLSYNSAAVDDYGQYPGSGYSIRCLKDNGSSIEKIKYSETINIYPNPTTGVINLNLPVENNSSFSIFDMQGTLVMSGEINSNKLDISSLANGMYFVQFLSADHQKYITRKIVKE